MTDDVEENRCHHSPDPWRVLLCTTYCWLWDGTDLGGVLRGTDRSCTSSAAPAHFSESSTTTLGSSPVQHSTLDNSLALSIPRARYVMRTWASSRQGKKTATLRSLLRLIGRRTSQSSRPFVHVL
jgi:hypothetical protein